MTTLHLIRLADQGLQTIGRLHVREGEKALLILCTLELPWRGNERRISCIPEGTYEVVHRAPTKHIPHAHLLLLDVQGRSYICIHAGNFRTSTLGCPLVGLSHTDIDGDGLVDVTHSREAMRRLMAVLPERTTITITSAPYVPLQPLRPQPLLS